MLTTNEIKAIPLFSALESKEIEQLAGTSGDIHLRAGDWAVHEAGERALFAVGEGSMAIAFVHQYLQRDAALAPGRIDS
jgi:thioredoxin reductase (NADPH)